MSDPGPNNMIAPGATYWLPNIPSQVDCAELRVEIIMRLRGYPSPLHYPLPPQGTEVFIVLDEPKEPMSPAWVSLLRYSCWWGRGMNNLDDAAQAITFGGFFQRPGFAYPTNTRAHWLVVPPDYPPYTFMLKALLDRWNAGTWTGRNCVDASCLTMLALCSVGMDFSTRQLTGKVDPFTVNFLTNPICPIGSDPNSRVDILSTELGLSSSLCSHECSSPA